MTSPYHIRIAPAAYQQIKELQPKSRKILIKLVEALAVNPRPPGSRKVEGMMGLYSEEVNNMRLIYKIEDQEILVLLVR